MKGSVTKSQVQKDEEHFQLKNLQPTLIKTECKYKDRTSRNRPSTERTRGPPAWRNHLPPKTLRATPVTVVKRKKERNFTHNETRKAASLPALKDCITSRPPIKCDLQGPTVYSYNVPKDKPEMTSFPAYTFRSKMEPDRDGGDRTAWGKEWFSHNYVWLQRTDYDPRVNWPSPAHYDLPSAVGVSSTPYHQAPAHSFGKRHAFTLVRKGLEDEPAPTTYDAGVCKDSILNKSSSYTIPLARKRGTVLWSKRDCVPGPGSYETSSETNSIKPRSAAYTFASSPRTLNLQKQCTY